jgi:hypothetical protein
MLNFIAIRKGHNGFPVLGIGTKNAVYTASIPSWFQWKIKGGFYGTTEGPVSSGYDSVYFKTLNFFPFTFRKKTIIPPPPDYKGMVLDMTTFEGSWYVGE